MAESTKFFRQKKGAWIYIFDTETNRKKKVELELIIKSLNSGSIFKKYFVLKEERNKFAEEFRSQCPFITSLK
jgi:uncharacterized Fe-S cluster-containing MiaB family protein|tara:strand:- start:588 stop:806 length:219 start_codon:yes stop_codon:yes gene_type:complete